MGTTHAPVKGAPNCHVHPIAASVALVGQERLRPTHLRATLTRLLQRENEEWEPMTFDYVTGQGDEVDVIARDYEVRWQGQACRSLGWAHETQFTAAALLDRLLHRVRIPTRYLHAVAAAAVFLAAKLHEEDENVPSTLEVVELGEMDCSHRELLRMEMVLLDKLAWNPQSSFILDFLQVLHALAIVTGPKHQHGNRKLKQEGKHFRSGSPTRQLSYLTERLWQVVCSGSSGGVRPSLISLAVLSLDLDSTTCEPGLTLWLQALTQVSDDELAATRELVQDLLDDGVPMLVEPVEEPQPSNSYNASPSRPNKRKVDQSMDPEEDDLYSDIKKLYASEKITASTCLLDKVVHNVAEEMEDPCYDIRHLYSPVPVVGDPLQNTSDVTATNIPGLKKTCGAKKKKKKTKATFKAKSAVKSLKQAFKIPCKISLISTKKIFEEPPEEVTEEDMDLDGEYGVEPIVEPVGLLKSPIFSPMSPEFPDIRHYVVKNSDIYWQKHAQEVTEQVYRPLTYAQVLRLHLSPFTHALGV